MLNKLNGNKINFQLFNDDNSVRWNLILENINGDWQISEDCQYSLFPNPLVKDCICPGDALEKFLEIETNLIENL